MPDIMYDEDGNPFLPEAAEPTPTTFTLPVPPRASFLGQVSLVGGTVPPSRFDVTLELAGDLPLNSVRVTFEHLDVDGTYTKRGIVVRDADTISPRSVGQVLENTFAVEVYNEGLNEMPHLLDVDGSAD